MTRLLSFALICISITTTIVADSCCDQKPEFPMEKLFPWAIVPYDIKERGPEERLTMLKEMGSLKDSIRTCDFGFLNPHSSKGKACYFL